MVQNNSERVLGKLETCLLRNLVAGFSSLHDEQQPSQRRLRTLASAAGNIYVINGNGTFDTSTPRVNYGESFLKLTSNGPVADFFTPSDFSSLNSGDVDMGSGDSLLLPDQPENFPHLEISAGKEGTIYVVNRDNFGQFNSTSNNVVQSLVKVMNGLWSSPGY